MVAKKSIGKLNDYFDRLDANKADKIKESHVLKVIAKLNSKLATLKDEFAEATKETKKARIKGKIDIVEEQIKRAYWLLKAIQ